LNRRGFLHALGAAGSAAALPPVAAHAGIPEHNWEKYYFGDGPPVSDRLYQGPFPQYSNEAVVPGSDVVMVTTPSTEIVPNYGMGLVVYVSGDTGPPHLRGETPERSLEDLVKIPFTQKIYLRPNWRDVQKKPGKLDLPEWWQITFDLAKRYNKGWISHHAGEPGFPRAGNAGVPNEQGSVREAQGRVER
jgi:hypothetical protein